MVDARLEGCAVRSTDGKAPLKNVTFQCLSCKLRRALADIAQHLLYLLSFLDDPLHCGAAGVESARHCKLCAPRSCSGSVEPDPVLHSQDAGTLVCSAQQLYTFDNHLNQAEAIVWLATE